MSLKDKICKQEKYGEIENRKKKWSALSLGRPGQIGGLDMGQNCLMRLENSEKKQYRYSWGSVI